MDGASRVRLALLAWIIGVVALLAATALTLLRRTHGLPFRKRPRAMARVVGGAIWAVFPPGWVVGSLVAGLASFAGVFLSGFAITILCSGSCPWRFLIRPRLIRVSVTF